LRAAAIHDAARKGDVEKVGTLLETDPSSINAKDTGVGDTPLLVAVGNREPDGVKARLGVITMRN
jgi:hypothetical protein